VLALRTVTYCTENEETPMMGRMTLSYSVALIIGPAITGMIGTTTQTREDGSG
jgi:predicted MFS family arabinose efflux permease